MNLDRFSQGPRDPQEEEHVAICAGCSGKIFAYDEVYVLDDGTVLHADAFCLTEHLNLVKKIALEVIK